MSETSSIEINQQSSSYSQWELNTESSTEGFQGNGGFGVYKVGI